MVLILMVFLIFVIIGLVDGTSKHGPFMLFKNFVKGVLKVVCTIAHIFGRNDPS